MKDIEYSENKKNGVVYTPTNLANYTSETLLNFNEEYLDAVELNILDPAVGSGELLIALINQIYEKNNNIKVYGYETDSFVANQTQTKLKEKYPLLEIEIRNQDFLVAVEEGISEKFDFIIANPPYIRTQILGSKRSKRIAEKLNLKGRVDLYYAFLVCIKDILKENGAAAFITSNKFMTIKAGACVRNFILQNYSIKQITDLGDTKLFDASVLPCVIFFTLGKTENEKEVQFTSIYENRGGFSDKTIKNIFDAINETGNFKLENGSVYKFQKGYLNSVKEDSLWTISTNEQEEWLKKVEGKTWKTFSNIGKIRVGIKTTADNVFIKETWEEEKPEVELLKPLITHRNAGQIIPNTSDHWQVLYPHTVEGKKRVAYDLRNYPKAEQYLLKHYTQLSSRSYLAKAHRNWYEIWVPQNPESWTHTKIVFRDISDKPQFWLDKTGAIVNGDCYWIDIYNEVPDDEIYLALAIANSRFIEKFYDLKFNTKLYSGKRRFISQYVEQFPLPNSQDQKSQKVIELVKKIIVGDEELTADYKKEIDKVVEDIFTC